MAELTGEESTDLGRGCYLYAPRLLGSASRVVASGKTRSLRGISDPVDQAASGAEVRVVHAFDIAITRDGRPASRGRTRSGRTAANSIRLQVPQGNPDSRFVAMHVDEQGYISWIFPERVTKVRAAAGRGAGDRVSFLLPRDSAVSREKGAATRSLYGAIGKRLVKVISWIVKPLAKAGALELARLWENKNRPYGLRALPFAQPTDFAAWDKLTEGRALLFIHGTFSTSQSAFAGLSKPFMAKLSERYQGRVVGFDHPTLSTDPSENANELLSRLKAQVGDGALNLDVITHSRGGLVFRALSQLASDNLRFHKVTLVACPNLGTPLVDEKEGTALLERFSNALSVLPEAAVVTVLESVLTAIKAIYEVAVTGLPGLAAMDPEGEYLPRLLPLSTWPLLNGVGSHYMVPKVDGVSSLGHWVGSKFVDSYFKEANDLVVSTQGCFGKEGLPANRMLRLDREVNHLAYFAESDVTDCILRWHAD